MHRIALVITVLLAVTVSGCHLHDIVGIGWNDPAPSTAPSSSAADQKEVIVFYTEAEPYQGHPSTDQVLLDHSQAISTAIGFWWQIDRSSLDRIHPFSQTTEEGIRHTVETARAQGIRVEGLVHNLLYGHTPWSVDVADRLLQDPQAQSRLLGDIASQAQRLGLSGVNIDIENVPAAHRNAFSRFIEEAAAVFHDLGIELSVSVPAKTWDDPANGWSGAFDYKRLGQAADRIILMTYDEHGFVSGPGPIASSPWVEAAVQFAVAEIPAQKVFVGVAGYGFEWSSDGSPRYISHRQAVEQAARLGVAIQWDPRAESPYYTYWDAGGQRRDVWFENAASNARKIDFVNEYDLGGVALWRGGLEDPALWDVVTQKINVLK